MKIKLTSNPILTLKLGSAALLTLTIYYFWHIWKSYRFFKNRGLKTPPFRFLVGNLNEYIGNNDQSEVLQRWTKLYGKTYGYFEGHTPILVTSDLDLINEVFIKQFSNFSAKKEWLMDPPDDSPMVSLVVATKSRWKRMRNIINPTFSNLKLKELSPIMIKCIDDSFETFLNSNEQEVNITQFLKKVTKDIIWQSALTPDPESFENSKIEKYSQKVALGFSKFLRYSTPMYLATYFSEFRPWIVSSYTFFNWLNYRVTKNEKLIDPLYYVRQECIEIVNQRRKKNIQRNDYLQLLINAEANTDVNDINNEDFSHSRFQKKLTIDEIKMNLGMFIIAGYETIATSLCIVFYLLSKYPEEQHKLYDEIMENFPYSQDSASNKEPQFENLEHLEYMSMFIKEAARLYPIGNPNITRRCMVPTTINGIDIPYNLAIQVDVLTVHYDPEVWGPFDTKSFCPQRFSKEYKRNPAAYLAFGIGPKNCIGLKFAYVEMKLILAKFLRLFEILPCKKTVDEIKFLDGRVFRTVKDDIIISLKRRHYA